MQTMQAAKATPGILKMCGSQKLLDQLTECNKLLESVQKVRVALLLQCAAQMPALHNKSISGVVVGLERHLLFYSIIRRPHLSLLGSNHQQ